MTTDVINGVPRSLLERCVLLAQDAMGLDFDEHAAIERDIRELLATAQPAADGERESFEAWAASVGYHTERDMFQREKYQSSLTWELWRVWQARAARAQQAVAVTDEVLRDAERYRYIRSEGIPDEAIAIVDSFYGELELVSPKRLDAAIDAALAAHKTGEEE